jgi:hypothetical protein
MLGAQQAGGSKLETLLHEMPLSILIVHERTNAKSGSAFSEMFPMAW